MVSVARNSRICAPGADHIRSESSVMVDTDRSHALAANRPWREQVEAMAELTSI
jgi:hypothetical protein